MQVDYEANKKALQYFVFGIGEDPESMILMELVTINL